MAFEHAGIQTHHPGATSILTAAEVRQEIKLRLRVQRWPPHAQCLAALFVAVGTRYRAQPSGSIITAVPLIDPVLDHAATGCSRSPPSRTRDRRPEQYRGLRIIRMTCPHPGEDKRQNHVDNGRFLSKTFICC
jgi:hypothetical protein